MSLWVWVPFMVGIQILSGYLSVKLNQTQNNTWFFLSWGLVLIPIWQLVAKYSKNLIFDGLIFDVIIIIVYTLSTLYFSKNYQQLTWVNIMGLIIIFIGIFLFKR